MKSAIYIVLVLCLLLTATFAQNVGVNSTGAAPDASSVLDVSSTDKGFLIPRVMLTATNVAAPITTPAISLLVYNTNTAGSGSTAVSPGFYYWDGLKWIRFQSNLDYDKDWFEVGSSLPPDAITDDMYHTGNIGVGKNTTSYPLDILGQNKERTLNITSNGTVVTGPAYSIYQDITTNVSTTNTYQYALANVFSGSSNNSLYAVSNTFQNSGTAAFTGFENNFLNSNPTSGASRYGLRNWFYGPSAGGSMYGVHNYFLRDENFAGFQGDMIGLSSEFASGKGTQTGVRNLFHATPTGNRQHGLYNYFNDNYGWRQYGVYSEFTATDTAVNELTGVRNIINSPSSISMYGVRTSIGGTGTGTQYGNYTDLSGSANNTRYAYYGYADSLQDGVHYGLYADVNKSNSYAAYLLGRVSIGSTTLNNYIFPRFRGNNGDVMITDGIGNVSWKKPDSLSNSYWTRVNDSLYPTTITDNISIGTTVATAPLTILAADTNTVQLFNTYNGFNTSMNLRNYITGSGSGDRYGVGNMFSGIGIGSKFGIRNTFTAASDGPQYAMYSTFSSTKSPLNYGVYNIFNSVANAKFGTYNDFQGIDNGAFTGDYNLFSNTGTGSKIAMQNIFNTNSNGQATGLFNTFSSQSTYTNFGLYNFFTNSRASFKYGAFNIFSGSDSSSIYGYYNSISNTGTGTRYGFYNSISGAKVGTYYGLYNTITGGDSADMYGVYSNMIIPVNADGFNARYGTYNRITNNSSSVNVSSSGVLNFMLGASAGKIYGVTNIMGNAGSSSNNIGINNVITGQNFDNTTQIGVFNSLFDAYSNKFNLINGTVNSIYGNSNGRFIGTLDSVASYGSGDIYGNRMEVHRVNSNAGTNYGNYIYMRSAGSGTSYGSRIDFGSGSSGIVVGNGAHYGYYVSDTTTGNNTHYGIYSSVAGGKTFNFGIYASASGGTTNYAGMFNGDVVPAVSSASAATGFRLGIPGLVWRDVYCWRGAFNASDIRFKENIKPLPYGLKEILKLNPITYTWKADSLEKNKKYELGLSSQQVLTILPEVVNVGDDSVHTLMMNYSSIIPVLVKAIQEQQKIIETQNQSMQQLKSEFTEKEKQLNDLQKQMEMINKLLGIGLQAKKEK